MPGAVKIRQLRIRSGTAVGAPVSDPAQAKPSERAGSETGAPIFGTYALQQHIPPIANHRAAV